VRHSIAPLFLAVLCACSHPPAKTVAQKPAAPDRFAQQVPADRYPDDVARFLAGLSAKPGTSLVALHERPVWAEHRDEWDRAWSELDKRTLTPIRAFARKELFGLQENQAVFYPFSGPDSLIITSFFPRNPVYVMVGLEPAGTLPKLSELDRPDLGPMLAKMRSTLESELVRSFFITRQMDRQIRGQVTDGVLLPLAQLLVRNGHTILGLRYVRVDEQGKLTDRVVETRDNNLYSNKGVEIDFKTDADQSFHKLFYFSVNLSDAKLQTNPGFTSFVAGLTGAVTYFKATSYMTHRKEFSIIRDRVLATSAAVLQDDSGIPFRYYAAPQWRVQLYGEYRRPIGDFHWLQQSDLKTAYETNGPKPLDFRIGYGFGKMPSNLLFAVKNAEPAQRAAN
jgi:hypothetical protein